MQRSGREDGQPLIALVLPSIGLGGAEIVNITLAQEFLRRGFRVDLVTGADEPESRVVVPEDARHVALDARRTREMCLQFARYLSRERPACALVSMWPLTTICVLAHGIAASKSRIVLMEHNTLSIQYRDYGPMHRLMLRKSIALSYPYAHERVSVSCGVADDLADLSGIGRDRFSVVHNPLHRRAANADGATVAEAFWGGWTGPRIITVGRFKRQKNHAMLIHAFKRLLDTRDARLLMLGTGDLFEATKSLATAEGISDKIFMPGPVADPTPFYRSADLFALSSDHEGFGNVIVEALACGLPVISTDCRSGPAEILENGRFGCLVPVGDAETFARAMADALKSTHDHEALRRRAADFAPERIADQYLNLLFPKVAPSAASVQPVA